MIFFSGFQIEGSGLRLSTPDGEILEVLNQGDVLDGRTVSIPRVEAESISDLEMVAWVPFTDGHRALYLIRVREQSIVETGIPTLSPSAIITLAALLAILGAGALRRRGLVS